MKSIYLLGLCCLFGNAHAGLNVIADLGGNLPHLILTALIISPMNLNHQTRRRRCIARCTRVTGIGIANIHA